MEALVRSESAYPTPFANTSVLPLLLMSLMQQKHSPTIHNRPILKSYDYIIVGAGSAGSVLASRLSEVPCVTVLLLEAGKPPPYLTDVPALISAYWTSDVCWHFFTVPQKKTAHAMIDNKVYWTAGKTLGGGSVANLMVYVRGNNRDYDTWAKDGCVGWSYNDVKPYFLKAENNSATSYLANGFHAVDGGLSVSKNRYNSYLRFPLLEGAEELGIKLVDPNARRQTGLYDTEQNIRHGQRCSTAKGYLVPAEDRPNLQIVPQSLAYKVILKGKKAVGVQFEHQGQVRNVKAKREVILSAGAINSAQLLMLSGIGPKEELQKHNIPVVADLPVGQNLQNHVSGIVYFEVDPKIEPLKERTKSNATVQAYIQNRTGLLSSGDLGLPIVFYPNSNNASDYPDYQLYFQEISAPTKTNPNNNFKPEIIKKFFLNYTKSNLYKCESQILRPKSRGTIRLNSTDPHVYPLIDPNYFDNPYDLQTIVNGMKLCKKIGTSQAMQQVGSKVLAAPFPGCESSQGNDDAYFRCLVQSFVVPFHHQSGTNRMGYIGDSRTVVCPKLKVKGIKNLRVVDASVMPNIPSGNTNNPTAMVAEKAADMIKSTIDCPSQISVANR